MIGFYLWDRLTSAYTMPMIGKILLLCVSFVCNFVYNVTETHSNRFLPIIGEYLSPMIGNNLWLGVPEIEFAKSKIGKNT